MQISIWEKESFFAPRDIIIIGAGLMGLWCAYELKKKNSSLKILILEKGIIPSGASTRNAGFSCFGSVTELLHDAKKIGEEKMWQIVEMRYKGMKKISKIFSDDEIDSDNCGGYECVTKTLHDLNDLKEKIIWLNKGLKQITSLDETFVFANDKLKKFGFKNFDGLIENNLEGGLHSGKLVQALTRKVQSLGVDILTGITAINWEENKNEILIRTDKNVCLTASQLLVCTNAFSNQLSKNIEITPARGQILVTSPIENLKLNGT
ncbi:MAG: NAD(P)/FAD-dependent oxidoreductase, partial [Chitinophagaceae bacterium]